LIDRIETNGWTVQAAAELAGISERTTRKWLARRRAEGEQGLLDRSSAPKVVANKTGVQTEQLIGALRRLRFTAPELTAGEGPAPVEPGASDAVVLHLDRERAVLDPRHHLGASGASVFGDVGERLGDDETCDRSD
jgi:hypothetical protein